MTRIEAVLGDLTLEDVDAIVNAANSELLGGGGVDGAIHRAGGPSIYDECLTIRRTIYPHGLPEGEAVATRGGDLSARWVVHTVGPRYGRTDGAEAALLASCHRRSLEVAADLGARTVSFPAISCGVFGYPAAEAAPIAVAAVRAAIAGHPDTFDVVRFVLWNERILAPFAAAVATG
jgi:O-acetyl-ADP-ribose deacetylase (regulator of RNase III)